jgi:hypothetical protein
MAFNKSLQITSTTYAGEFALPYINAAVLAAESISKGYVTVLDGATDGGIKMNIGSQTGAAFGAYSCDFSATQGIDLSERVLEVTKFKLDREFCKTDFQNHWQAQATGATFRGQELPSEFQDWFIGFQLSKIAEAIEYNIWGGNYTPGGLTAVYTAFDGICEILDDEDENVLDLKTAASGNAAIAEFATPADVNYNLAEAVFALPNALIGQYDKAKIMVSPRTRQLYLQHLANEGVQMLYSAAGSEIAATFLGYDVISVAGMPANTILVADPANLFVGTRSVSDFNELSIRDMKEIDLSDNVRFRCQFTIGCNVAVPADCVLVRPSIT